LVLFLQRREKRRRKMMRRLLIRATSTEGTAVWIPNINTNVPVTQITTHRIAPPTIPTTSDHTLPMVSEDFEMRFLPQVLPMAMASQHHLINSLNLLRLSSNSKAKRCVGSEGRLILSVLRRR
jgi:hypothetical protein